MKRNQHRILAAVSVVMIAAQGAAAAPPAPKVWKEPITGMEFVAIERGCFSMGRDEPAPLPVTHNRTPIAGSADAGKAELPRHEVCVDSFWMSRYEMRVEDWKKLKGEPPVPGETGTPVVGVSWSEAGVFAKTLTQRSGNGNLFRLPTEAEWEYACRAGSKEESVVINDELIDSAWYGLPGKREHQPVRVGQLKPNAFGLHDMLGNAWEWVQDSFQRDGYAQHALYNPVVERDGDRVLRGGSHRSEPFNVRCSKRAHHAPEASQPHIGFRLVRIAR